MDALVVADDLTGALEAGAQLAAEGIECVVAADGERPPDTPAAVLDIATRHMGAAEAARAVHDAVAQAREVRHIFLKTDSTLRGRIRESLTALMAEFPQRRVVYVPAYPALGRTVRGGVLFVDGVPLEATAFARDPLDPVRESSIAALLGAAAGGVEVVDGESEADLAAAAEGLRGQPAIVAGTAAFARYWARLLPVPRATPPAIPRASGGLAVIGSRHPASRAQARRAAVARVPGWTIYESPAELCGQPLEVAARCGAAVRDILERAPVEALAVFGGDTAAAILKAIDCRLARPCGELLAGVPVSRIEALGRTFLLVTKAGGFGGEQTLLRIIDGLGRAS